ncbi:MAG: alpha/beta hydrolase [Clostridia bacterium]
MQIYYKGIKLHYEVVGEGSPILFLHGWGGRIESFAPIYQELKKTHKCILIDFIGFGDSGIANVVFTLDDYVDSVKLLLRHIKIESCDLIAHSFGGRVALKLMAGEKDLITRAILVAPAGIRPKRDYKYHFKVWKYKAKKKLFKVGIISEKSLHKDGSRDYRELTPLMKGTFVNIVNDDLTDISNEVSSDVLLIYGEGDESVPRSMVEELKNNIKGSEYITLGGGHFCYLVEAGAFCKIAQSFFS